MPDPREAAMALHWLDGMRDVQLLSWEVTTGTMAYVTGFDAQGRQCWAWINADVWNKWKGENP